MFILLNYQIILSYVIFMFDFDHTETKNLLFAQLYMAFLGKRCFFH